MKTFRFSVTGTPRLDLRLPLGELRVMPGAPGVVDISLDGREAAVARVVVEQRGDVIHLEPERHASTGIRWSSVDVVVAIGEPADIHARLTSGDLTITTDLASLAVETVSGELVAGLVRGDAVIRSASGDVRLGDVAGRLDVALASGDLRAEVVGNTEVKSASGDIAVREVRGDIVARSASGNITVGRFGGDRLDAKSMSGDVTIGIPSGRRYDVAFSTISGEVRTDFPVQGSSDASAPARLEVKTVSGDIRVRSA